MISTFSEIILVETTALDFRPEGGGIVALSPETSKALDEKGIPHSILEDYYDERDIFKDEEGFFAEQNEWFRKFDQIFYKNIEYLRKKDVGMATAHYYRLKSFIDSLVIYAAMFRNVIRNTGVRKVRYLGHFNDDFSAGNLYSSFASQRKILGPLLKAVCESEGVDFLCESFPIEKSEAPNQSVSVKVKTKEFLKELHAKSVYRFFALSKWKKGRTRKGSTGVSILSLHAGCVSMDKLMKDNIKDGGEVFLKQDNDIFLISSFFEKRLLKLKEYMFSEEDELFRLGLERVYDLFMGESRLSDWIDVKCKAKIMGIVGPYFEQLIKNECFENILESRMLAKFYSDNHIDFVVTRASSERDVVSSLMGAFPIVKRACFQHSCGAHESRREYACEFTPFDYYFAMHSEAEDRAQKVIHNANVSQCKIYQAPSQVNYVVRKWKSSKRHNELVLYVPTKVFLGFRVFNGYLYPITWYYNLQKSIIDLFIKKKDTKFIFKHAPGQDWSEKSIIPYIKEKSNGNIRFETKSVSECLGKVGRVILDYPSTSFYEAAAAGVSVMSLHHELLGIAPEAKKMFGRSLRLFRDISEAVSIVDEFLLNDPEGYKVDIPVADINVVEELRRIKMENDTKQEKGL